VICDCLSESSVRKCVAEIITKTSGSGIDFLILNAGISGSSSPANRKDKKGNNGADDDEKEKEKAKKFSAANVWMTNHVGPWIFANELMPSLVQATKKRTAPSDAIHHHHPRAVWVSSGAHKNATIDWNNPFHPTRASGGDGLTFSSYGQSKLANIMHAREYQKRIREMIRNDNEAAAITTKTTSVDDKKTNASNTTDIKCFALTPGAVWTNIMPKIPMLYPLFWAIMRSPKMGAQVIKMACLDNDLKGGEYLSNCCVKESRGVDGCSNNEGQWRRLWELTERQVREKEYEKFIENLDGSKKTD